jgi:hypothetical protein
MRRWAREAAAEADDDDNKKWFPIRVSVGHEDGARQRLVKEEGRALTAFTAAGQRPSFDRIYSCAT